MTDKKTDRPDVTPQDALEIAQRAMQKANEVDTLRERIEDLEDELAAVKIRQQERDDNTGYDQLTLDEKIGLVRQHGVRKAQNSHGKATLDYDDVRWEVFSGEPGAKHCYKLIRRAAGLTDDKTGSEHPGFTARDPDGGNYHLAVNADRAKASVNLFPENKDQSAGAD